MASPTYRTKGIVVRKSRLGESDLIVELIDEAGRKLKLVAKGARKPSGRFSAHLELFNTCELLCVKGKNLDIAKESRLVVSRGALMVDPLKNAAASTIAELLSRMTQVSLEQNRLFEMTEVAFDAMECADTQYLPSVVAADILKTVAVAGLRPVLTTCALCGAPQITDDEMASACFASKRDERDVRFSHLEGGLICSTCAPEVETMWVSYEVVKLAQRLLMARFDEIIELEVDGGISFELLQLLQMWVGVHVGTRLKSLTFFMDMHYMRV